MMQFNAYLSASVTMPLHVFHDLHIPNYGLQFVLAAVVLNAGWTTAKIFIGASFPSRFLGKAPTAFVYPPRAAHELSPMLTHPSR